MFQSAAVFFRLALLPTDGGDADCPSLRGKAAEKDSIGYAALSITLFLMKMEWFNH